MIALLLLPQVHSGIIYSVLRTISNVYSCAKCVFGVVVGGVTCCRSRAEEVLRLLHSLFVLYPRSYNVSVRKKCVYLQLVGFECSVEHSSALVLESTFNSRGINGGVMGCLLIVNLRITASVASSSYLAD